MNEVYNPIWTNHLTILLQPKPKYKSVAVCKRIKEKESLHRTRKDTGNIPPDCFSWWSTSCGWLLHGWDCRTGRVGWGGLNPGIGFGSILISTFTWGFVSASKPGKASPTHSVLLLHTQRQHSLFLYYMHFVALNCGAFLCKPILWGFYTCIFQSLLGKGIPSCTFTCFLFFFFFDKRFWNAVIL